MQPLFLIKTPHRQSYTETIHNFTDYEHTCQHINFKIQDITLIRKTPGNATAKRGARFHPTVGSVTPNEFTTSHPQDETTMLKD